MRLSSRKAFPSRISFAASMMPSGVRKLKHPTSSSSPNTPQLEWSGAPGLIGSWEYFGILLKSNFATSDSYCLRIALGWIGLGRRYRYGETTYTGPEAFAKPPHN